MLHDRRMKPLHLNPIVNSSSTISIGSSQLLHEIFMLSPYINRPHHAKDGFDTCLLRGVLLTTLSFATIISERSQVGRPPPDLKGKYSKFQIREFSFWYGQSQALFSVSLAIPERSVVALIGPSGCGKSTFLRSLNRMNDLIGGTRHTGEVLLDEREVYNGHLDLVDLRRRVGMVFQKSNPFPKSVFDNVVFGPRQQGCGTARRFIRLPSAHCDARPYGMRS